MLATLLLHAGHVVSVAALASALWDDDPPASTRNTIQGQVKRLRQALGAESARIVTRSPGYLIEVHPGELDLWLFTGFREQAREAAQAGEWGRSAKLLGEALALWAGDPLSDVPSAYLRRTEVPRLTELRHEALEARIDADLHLGRHGAVIAELRGLVAEHPFRERLWQQLMLALYRCGRQSDALAAYQDARGSLRSELGIDPGAGLQELHNQILTGDPALTAEIPAAAASQPGPALAGKPRQLPADLPDFTGREEETSRLRALLTGPAGTRPGSVAVAVISGPGGIGKTALAVHVAHRVVEMFPDGQLFVGLGGATSPVPVADLLARLLRDLGVPDRAIPASTDERAARYRTAVADKKMLVVLDDAHGSAQVRPLLPGTGGSAVLVTSRSVMADLAGAAFTGLTVLGKERSRALFTAIVGERRAADDPGATDDVVASCAGLPLAIRIAGSRLATRPGWTTGQLSERLASEHQRLGELATGDTAVRASFEVSYLALPPGKPDPARVFRLFGLAGLPSLTVQALAALAASPVADTAESVAALMDAHLLESPEPGRYQAHDLLRLYATERSDSDETEASRRDAMSRLLRWYLHTLDACVRKVGSYVGLDEMGPLPPDVPEPHITALPGAVEWLRSERASLIRTVTLADRYEFDEICWQLAAVMRYYFEWAGYWNDQVAVATTGLAAAERCGSKEGAARLLNVIGAAQWKLGRPDEAARCYSRALTLRRELGDRTGEATLLSNLGLLEADSGATASAVDRFTRALAINRELEHPYGESYCLHNLGWVHELSGRPDEALAYYEQALAIRVRHSPLPDQAASMHSIGALLLTMGRVEEAMSRLRRALKICQDNHVGYGEGVTLASLGDGYQALGKLADARAAWQRALDILTELGAPEAPEVASRLAARGGAR